MGKHLMDHPLHRKPFAFANWKMAMTIGEMLDFMKSPAEYPVL